MKSAVSWESGLRTMNALGTSSLISSGTPTTATSAIPSNSIIIFSNSVGET